MKGPKARKGAKQAVVGGAVVKKIAPARLAAFEILRLVGEGKGHSDELLHSERMEMLSVQDRNLTTALVMGVLRWQIALDARIRTLLQRPDQRLAETVSIALRMGAFQLLHMDRIPAHAATERECGAVPGGGRATCERHGERDSAEGGCRRRDGGCASV